MCYSLYISIDSPADFCVFNTDLVRFQKAENYEYQVEAIIGLLGFRYKWFVGSQSGCSCTFRHLNAVELGFGKPEDWYPEDQVALDATQQLYDIIKTTLSSGYHVDCIDAWAGVRSEEIKTLAVSLDAVSKEAFRFFENYKFAFEKAAKPNIASRSHQ